MADMKALLLGAGVPIAPDRIDALNVYHDLLIDWNTRMDLTSVPDAELARRHFLDSLLPLTKAEYFPEGLRLIDVGTGAGFPGLALQLQNVTVIQERAEVLGRAEGHREAYDRAVARAVAPLNVLCEYLLPFVRVGGYALCWKGPNVTEEMADGTAAAEKLGGALESLVTLAWGNENHLLSPIRKIETTLPQYPRKNGIPAKRPLKKDK